MLDFHVLNARDNGLIPWVFSALGRPDPKLFQRSMQQLAEEIRTLLASRGIRYEDLKSSLVPTRDGIQVVFLYNWLNDPAPNYAVSFARSYLPILRKDLRSSMLHGDLNSLREFEIPIQDMEESVVRAHSQPVNWQAQYAVYFTNLRRGDVASIHESLLGESRYTGYIDVSFASSIRNALSLAMVPGVIFHERKTILRHDRDDITLSNEDPVGFDFPFYGYEVVSLTESYFLSLLSYKIEAYGAYQAATDRLLNLASITGELIDLDATSVVVPPDKLEKYLLHRQDKLRLMVSIGLEDVTPETLASVVKTKLSQSYIYNLRFAASDNTPLFAVSAEFERLGRKARRLLALKHDRAKDVISLVTMY